MMRLSTNYVIALALFVSATSEAAPATAQTASLGMTSTRASGVVSIQTDPVLSNGRLVMKVAAHNSTSNPSELSLASVQVRLGSEKPIALLTVDQLITEARGGPSAEQSLSAAHQASDYSRPTTTTSQSGELDVSGITGASNAIGRGVPERPSGKSKLKSDPATEAQVEALKAGILQTLAVPAGKAVGAQVVTEKIKFPRKDPRVLHVTVTFNGDTHEFEFEAPPAK
jgi:hypothetical protein